MTARPALRDAGPDDARACAAIYAPYVTGTAVSFEVDPPDDAEFARRIAAASVWLVAELGQAVVGYAYAAPWRARAAYRGTCETSVYLAPSATGRGLGRALYAALFDRLPALGLHVAVAGMTVPNPASQALHESFGFTPVGVFREVGRKFDAWHDVAWWQRAI